MGGHAENPENRVCPERVGPPFSDRASYCRAGLPSHKLYALDQPFATVGPVDSALELEDARRMPGRGRRTLGTQTPHLAERLGGRPVGILPPIASLEVGRVGVGGGGTMAGAGRIAKPAPSRGLPGMPSVRENAAGAYGATGSGAANSWSMS